MALTYRYIVWDVLSILKETDSSSELTEDQVMFWCNVIANRLRAQRIVKQPTGRYLNIFTGITVQTSLVSTNPNLVKNRKYVDLPRSVYDIIHEKGISYICHTQDGTCPPEFMGLIFQPTTPAIAHRLGYSPYEEPSPKNPYFYRTDQNRIYFLGLETANVRSLEMGLYTTLDLKTNLFNLDDECDLVEEHVQILQAELLKLGSFEKANLKDDINDQAEDIEGPQKVAPIQTPQTSEG